VETSLQILIMPSAETSGQVPAATAAALLEAGAVNGGTPAEVCATDLNLRKETLKAVVVAATYHDAREGKR